MKRNWLMGLFALLLMGCGEAVEAPPANPTETAMADPVGASRALYDEATAALEAGDVDGYREHLRAALALRPHHPTFILLTARAHVLAGEPEAALPLIARFADMGLTTDLAADTTFAPLHGEPAFDALVRRIEANAAPVVASTEAFAFDVPDFIPESVAYDPVDDAFYVGSVHRREIVRVARDGTVTPFADAEDGLWSVFGLKVDAPRRRLWAATGAIEQTRDLDSLALGQTGLVAFDLATGTPQSRVLAPDDGDPHWFGDLALDADGHAFLTDSRTGAIYALAPDTNTLTVFLADPGFSSLQGLAFSEDGQTLYVADYARGIYRIDRATKALTLLPYPADATLLGIDGLYAVGETLLAIQNGVRPHRVVRAVLAPGGARIARVEVVEAAHPAYDEPTLGVVVGEALYYVANSQWGHFDAAGRLADPAALRGPVVLRLPLR